MLKESWKNEGRRKKGFRKPTSKSSATVAGATNPEDPVQQQQLTDALELEVKELRLQYNIEKEELAVYFRDSPELVNLTIDKLEATCNTIELQNQNLAAKADTLGKENEKIKQFQAEVHEKHLDITPAEMWPEIKELLDHNRKLMEANKRIQEAEELMETKLRDDANQLAKMKDDIAPRKVANENFKQQIAQLRQELQSLQNEAANEGNSKEQLERETNQLKRDNAQLQKQVDQLVAGLKSQGVAPDALKGVMPPGWKPR